MADLAKIVEDLSALTVLEAAELSKMLEEKWGVSARLAKQAVADDVWEALKDVVDPELGINVVDLGLVYDVHLDEGKPIPGMFETTIKNLYEVSPVVFGSAPIAFGMLAEAMERDGHRDAMSFRDEASHGA